MLYSGSRPGFRAATRLLFLCAAFGTAVSGLLLHAGELPDVDLLFTKNSEIYRVNVREATAGVLRETLLAEDFAGRFIRRRPHHEDQFAYAKANGLVVMDRCGQKIIDFTRPGTGSGFHNDFVWSHSGQFIIYGVYNGVFNGSPDPGINRLNPNTGEGTRLLAPQGFTYEHSPAYSLDDRRISYVHHEYETRAWFGVIDATGGERRLWIRLPDTYRDAHQFFTWIDSARVLGFNSRESALILVDTTGEGSYSLFPLPGATTPLVVSPSTKRYALWRSQRIAYGEIGNWTQLKEVPLDGAIENYTWVDDNHLAVYTRTSISMVTLDTSEVQTIAATTRTTTYGIEALHRCPE